MPKMKWSYRDVKMVAITCSSRTQLADRFPGAYGWAKRNGRLDDACSHMQAKTKTWDYESVKAVAEECDTRAEFQRHYLHGDSPYKWAKRNGVLDELTKDLDDKPRKRMALPKRGGKFSSPAKIAEFIIENGIRDKGELHKASRSAYESALVFRIGVTKVWNHYTGNLKTTGSGEWHPRILEAFESANWAVPKLPPRNAKVQSWCVTPGCQNLQCRRTRPNKDGSYSFHNVCRRCRKGKPVV